jgi:hypothetical protein
MLLFALDLDGAYHIFGGQLAKRCLRLSVGHGGGYGAAKKPMARASSMKQPNA